MAFKGIVHFAAGAALLALAACGGGGDKAPQGQVVATVNGVEVTAQELNAEAAAANIPANADKKQVMPLLLQRVIDRKLLADAAKERKLDQSADYLIQERRAQESVLASMLAKQLNDNVTPPTRADAEKFVAENPAIFANRTRYVLDQIRFASPAQPQDLAFLEPAKTMEQVVALLNDKGIKFERGAATLDSATADPRLIEAINKLAPGEPFVVPIQQVTTVSAVKRQERVSLEGDTATTAATQLLRARGTEDALKKELDAARAKAKISYQEGMEPPANNGQPAPAALGGATPAATPAPAAK